MAQEYDYHAQAPIWDGAWTGKWNCSSFLAWGLWQVGDRRMLGCRPYKPWSGSGATFPEWWKTGRIWAWTGWFYEDLERYAIRVSEDEAVNTPGVIGMYRRKETENRDGFLSGHVNAHIAISLGANRILEAHGEGVDTPYGKTYGPKPGVINYRNMSGRFAHWYRLA